MTFVRGKSLFTKLTMLVKYKSSSSEIPYSEMTSSEIANLFEEWKVKHGKIYKTPEEKLHRFEIFKDTLRYVEERNKVISFRVGLNSFSDMTSEEFRAIYCAMRNPLDDPEYMAAMLRRMKNPPNLEEYHPNPEVAPLSKSAEPK